MLKRIFALSVCLLAAALLSPANAQEVRQESGSLQELVDQLTSKQYLLHCPTSDKRPFVKPHEELRFARRAANLLAVGEVAPAAKAASRFGYEVVEFCDTQTRQQYYLLREDLSSVNEPRGWGAYLLNPSPAFNTLVEAPHPLGDSKTVPLAAEVFAAGARGLLIAGAHRDKADLPDFVESIFHQVHAAWVGSSGLFPVLQIHGFAGYKHDFPKDAQLVLSTGCGQVPEELIELDKQMDHHGFPSYVYNTLDPASRRNKRVNGDTPGKQFRMLAATKNVQGQHARGQGCKFMHLEFEYHLRHDDQRRTQAAHVVARTMAELAPSGEYNATLERPAVITVATDKPRGEKKRREAKEG